MVELNYSIWMISNGDLLYNSTVLELSGRFSFELILFLSILFSFLIVIQFLDKSQNFPKIIKKTITTTSYLTLFFYLLYFIFKEFFDFKFAIAIDRFVNSYLYFLFMFIINILNWSIKTNNNGIIHSFNKKIENTIDKFGHFLNLILLIFLLSQFSFNYDSILASDLKLFPNNNLELYKIFSMTWQFFPFQGGIYPLEKGSFYLSLIEFLLNQIMSSTFIVLIYICVSFLISYYGMYKLIKLYTNSNSTAILIGNIFAISPVFFNWWVFGWNYVVICFSALPYFIYFLENISIKLNYRKTFAFALCFGTIIFSSNIYFIYLFLLIMFYLKIILERKFKEIHFKFIFTLLGIFIPNLNWILPRVLFPNQGAVKIDSATSGQEASLEWFSPVTNFGITMNNSAFYLAGDSKLRFTIFIFAVLVLLNLIFFKNFQLNKNKLFFIMILIFSILISFRVNFFSSLIKDLNLPFRDLSRFIVLGWIATLVLSASTISLLKFKFGFKIFYLLVLFFTINTFYYFNGSLVSQEAPEPPILTMRQLNLESFELDMNHLTDSISTTKSLPDYVFLPNLNYIASNSNDCFGKPYLSIPNLFTYLNKKPIVDNQINSYKLNFTNTRLFTLGEQIRDKDKLVKFVIFDPEFIDQNQASLLNELLLDGQVDEVKVIKNMSLKKILNSSSCKSKKINYVKNNLKYSFPVGSKNLNFAKLQKIYISKDFSNTISNLTDDERVYIAKNFNLNYISQELLRLDQNDVVRLALAQNPYVNAKILSKLLSDSNLLVQISSFENRNLDIDSLLNYYKINSNSSDNVKNILDKTVDARGIEFTPYLLDKYSAQFNIKSQTYDNNIYIIYLNQKLKNSVNLQIYSNFMPKSFLTPEIYQSSFYINNKTFTDNLIIPQNYSPYWKVEYQFFDRNQNLLRKDKANINFNSLNKNNRFDIPNLANNCSISPCFVKLEFIFGWRYLTLFSFIIMVISMVLVFLYSIKFDGNSRERHRLI